MKDLHLPKVNVSNKCVGQCTTKLHLFKQESVLEIN